VTVLAASHYFHWGVLQISLGNLVVIALMVVVFVVALIAPFPRSTDIRPAVRTVIVPEPSVETTPGTQRTWTARVRQRLSRAVPPGQLLPDRQPAYVNSWIYVFGVLSAAALLVVSATGLILALEGAAWWHTSSVGHFVNSAHLWSVELFFAVTVVHLWGKFFMAAWRGNRGLTWATGAVSFFGSLGTAFTGYLSQTNFDSQWISTQAKDGLNAAGIGSRFNVLNGGQMLLWHVSLLPMLVGVIVILHLLLVRRHGVVPPIDVQLEPEPRHVTTTDVSEKVTTP
jgi:quinol-cytochrome oxidoreductase complex cytochrome b subunit